MKGFQGSVKMANVKHLTARQARCSTIRQHIGFAVILKKIKQSNQRWAVNVAMPEEMKAGSQKDRQNGKQEDKQEKEADRREGGEITPFIGT